MTSRFFLSYLSLSVFFARFYCSNVISPRFSRKAPLISARYASYPFFEEEEEENENDGTFEVEEDQKAVILTIEQMPEKSFATLPLFNPFIGMNDDEAEDCILQIWNSMGDSFDSGSALTTAADEDEEDTAFSPLSRRSTDISFVTEDIDAPIHLPSYSEEPEGISLNFVPKPTLLDAENVYACQVQWCQEYHDLYTKNTREISSVDVNSLASRQINSKPRVKLSQNSQMFLMMKGMWGREDELRSFPKDD